MFSTTKPDKGRGAEVNHQRLCFAAAPLELTPIITDLARNKHPR